MGIPSTSSLQPEDLKSEKKIKAFHVISFEYKVNVIPKLFPLKNIYGFLKTAQIDQLHVRTYIGYEIRDSIIIACDIMTGCSGCLHEYIEFNGGKTTKYF